MRWKLRLVGLDGFENHLPSEISGGMKKRAGIARALALEPPLLFLDEPSAGLDPISAVELDELILALNASLGVTMVIVTHEMQFAHDVSDRLMFIDGGKIVEEGDPAELIKRPESARLREFLHRFSASFV